MEESERERVTNRKTKAQFAMRIEKINDGKLLARMPIWASNKIEMGEQERVRWRAEVSAQKL